MAGPGLPWNRAVPGPTASNVKSSVLRDRREGSSPAIIACICSSPVFAGPLRGRGDAGPAASMRPRLACSSAIPLLEDGLSLFGRESGRQGNADMAIPERCICNHCSYNYNRAMSPPLQHALDAPANAPQGCTNLKAAPA